MSSEARHTPGPCSIEPDGWARYIHIKPNVAQVKTYDQVKTHDREHYEANARLIAAAPELLEAAKEVRRLFNGDVLVMNEKGKALDALIEAIEKAEGRK